MDAPDEGYVSLFDAEFTHVRRTVYVLVGDAPTAEDITQDAFVQALLHWSRIARYDRPDAWVRRVAIRLAVRHLRRESRRELIERTLEPARSVGPPDPDLTDAIRGLPAKQRAVLVLFYYEDRPMKEIAELLGMSESTGFVHLHRARRRLGESLGEWSPDVAGA